MCQIQFLFFSVSVLVTGVSVKQVSVSVPVISVLVSLFSFPSHTYPPMCLNVVVKYSC